MARFKPGQSGNPAGRKKGVPDRRSKLRRELESRAPALIQKTVEIALEGDVQALRLCLERIVPALRPQSPTVRFQAGESATETAQGIISAIAEGSLPPDIGERLIASLGHLSKLREIDELERRIRALEEREGEL